MSGEHAFLPASGAAAWESCAAWALMNATFPQDDTEASLEGTAAHWCWEPHLKSGADYPAAGSFAPNGVQITDEMLDGAELYVTTATEAARRARVPLDALHVEGRVYMPSIHPENWGTPDTWFYEPDALMVHVFDYKYGHDFVDAFENRQCVDYAAGIVEALVAERSHWSAAALAQFRQDIRVRVTLVQPRNYDAGGAVRTWETSGDELRTMWDRLRVSAAASMEYPPVATPGSHCKHCPGRHACAPLQRQGYQAVQFARQVIPTPLSPDAMAAELRILQDNAELLKARISGLEAEADARLRRGETVPGYMLEPTKGREAWRVPAEQILALGSVFGVEVAKPGLITPNQARTAGLPADVVAKLSGSSSGMKLARFDPKSAVKAFGK